MKSKQMGIFILLNIASLPTPLMSRKRYYTAIEILGEFLRDSEDNPDLYNRLLSVESTLNRKRRRITNYEQN